MTVDTAIAKNPAAGWDITTAILADKNEKLAHVQIRINDFPEYDKNIDPKADSWKNTLVQQGNYPGENRVVVTATSDDGKDHVHIQEWS